MQKLQGVIIGLIDEKTAKVEVTRQWQHPMYKKYVKRTKNYLVDVPAKTKVEVGGKVEIASCRPVSKLKRFAIVEVKEN